MAAGRAYPIADSPFDSRKVNGSSLRHACDTMNFTDPTSVMAMVSRGQASGEQRVTS
jgi:hypothetical protein